ncbi:transcription termination/antitermination protein NusA [bacterium]|nr:transcription termination/antitermination protein NusA [bacterium]
MLKNLKEITSALAQIAEEKGLSFEKVLEATESALAAAYKKDFSKKGEIIRAKLNPETGEVKFWQVKQVVDKSMVYTEEELEKLKKENKEPEEKKIKFNPKKHIMIEEAKKIDPNVKPGDELIFPLETKEDYGRIAAQTAKQVILQKLKEAERESIFEEFSKKEGEIVSGIVQRIEGKNVYLDLGKALGILPPKEQIPHEFYKPGQRLKVLVRKVEQTPKGPMIVLSRAYPKFVSKLFEIEVPEVSSGQVQIKSIAREPGSRTKIAVFSEQKEIDPIGAMVGQRGTRVAAVINTLGGEKIDIVQWSENPKEFIANALSPAKVIDVKLGEKGKAEVLVPENQLSLAIGKDGQNVRLAAKLTGWKIDVKPFVEEKEATEEKEEKEKKKDEPQKKAKEAEESEKEKSTENKK